MKKTIITALIALLIVLAFASCDGIITEPGAEKPEANKPVYTYTADGQKMVTVKINIGGTAGNSRSLTNTFAKGAANYVEVIFKDTDGKFYKKDGDLGDPLTVSVLVQQYMPSDAIILIGKRTGTSPSDYDYTLLATGTIEDSNGVDLTKGFSEITFKVTSLDVNLTTVNGNFEITNTWLGEFKYIDDSSGSDVVVNHTDKGRFLNGASCFLVPKNNDITAKLSITGFENTGNNIFVKLKSDFSSDTTGFLKFNKYDATTGAVSAVTTEIEQNWIIPNIASLSSPSASPPSSAITFGIKTITNGFYTINFDIPVIGLNSVGRPVTTSDPTVEGLTWKIRGGTNDNPDAPSTSGTVTAGGGVALRVADTVLDGQTKSVTITITW